MNIRSTLAKDWPVLLLLLLPFALTAYFWDQIPETIPTHWGIDGQPDGWSQKGWSVFFLPLITIGSYLLLVFVPYIDPKQKTDNRQKSLRAMRMVMPLLLTGIFLIMMLQWIGYTFDVGRAIYLCIALLFLVIGNYMQSLKHNYFIGIRTPWTLESEEIWRKTHRFGGKLWVAGALLMIALWFFLDTTVLSVTILICTLTMAFLPIGYSLYLYMKQRKELAE